MCQDYNHLLAWEATDGFNFDLSKATVLKNTILTLS